MKTWTLVFKEVDVENFNQIKSGLKSIETRAARPIYQPIEVGDEILFTCGDDKFTKIVIRKDHFSDIDEMLEKIKYNMVMPSAKSVEEVKKAYLSYPNYAENLKKYGVFAFKLD